MADQLTTELKNLETEFKSAIERNDEAATVRLNDAISTIEKKMRDLEIAANRPQAGDKAAHEAEVKSAIHNYMRSGNRDAAIAEFKQMAITTGTPVGSDGGLTVPKVIDDQILKALVDISPMRSVARVVSTETTDFHIPFSNGGTASGWVGELDARTNTATSSLTDIVPLFGELYASPVVTQQLIEDSQFDIVSYVQGEATTEFARNEGAAFLNGTGVKQPKGLMTVPFAATADATRPFGTAQFTSCAAVNGNPISADALIAMVHTLKAGYRANAKFIMNKATLGVVRGLKDNYGQYLWTTSIASGNPSTLLGYEVVEMEDMANVANNAYPIAFGDFQKAYTIADRVGTSMLYNPYLNNGFITYQWRKRVGGIPVDTQAFKVLKTVSGS